MLIHAEKQDGRTDGRSMTKLIGALRDLRHLTYIVLRLIDYFVSQSIDLDEAGSTHTRARAYTHTHTHTHTHTEIQNRNPDQRPNTVSDIIFEVEVQLDMV